MAKRKKKQPAFYENWWFWVIIAAVIVAAVVLVTNPQLFTGVIVADVGADIDTDPGASIRLSVYPSNACVGESVTGSVTSNMPYAMCTLHVDIGTGYVALGNFQLNSIGQFSTSNSFDTPGNALLKVTCINDKYAGQSNVASLSVRFCAEDPVSTTTTTTSPSYTPWICCVVNRQMQCVHDNRCPDGIIPIQQYSSQSQCEDNCGIVVTTTTPIITTTTVGPEPMNCFDYCEQFENSPAFCGAYVQENGICFEDFMDQWPSGIYANSWSGDLWCQNEVGKEFCCCHEDFPPPI